MTDLSQIGQTEGTRPVLLHRQEVPVSTYEAFKNEIDRAMIQATEDFVYIGYLLSTARDNPEILTGSGYYSCKEFAEKEYGLEESQVSRFIAIHEKYGQKGRLLPQYKGYGQSKLAEMLSLPDVVAQEIPKDITREEIREIKREIREEEKVTPLERYMEPPAEGDTMADKVMHEFFRKYKDLFLKAASLIKYNGPNWENELKEFFMPAGETADTVRLSGIGTVVFTFRTSEIVFIQSRTQERESADWKTWGGALNALLARTGEPSERTWASYYGEDFEIAPAQGEKKDDKKEEHKEAPEEEKKKERPEETAELTKEPQGSNSEPEEFKETKEPETNGEPEKPEMPVEDKPCEQMEEEKPEKADAEELPPVADQGISPRDQLALKYAHQVRGAAMEIADTITAKRFEKREYLTMESTARSMADMIHRLAMMGGE